MATINPLSCCGIKEYATICSHFQDTTDVAESAQKCLDWFVQQWYQPIFKQVQAKDRFSPHYVLSGYPKSSSRQPWHDNEVTAITFQPRAAHIVFSDHGVVVDANGEKVEFCQAFADLIVEKKLGTVIKSEPKKNPNSGNTITAFMWSMDMEAFKEYVKDANAELKVGDIVRVPGGVDDQFIEDAYFLYNQALKEKNLASYNDYQNIHWETRCAIWKVAAQRMKDREAGKTVPPLGEKPVAEKMREAAKVVADKKEQMVAAYGGRPFRARVAAKTGRLS